MCCCQHKTARILCRPSSGYGAQRGRRPCLPERALAMTPAKRATDLIFALGLIGILAVPFTLLILFLLVREGRPVFYLSERMRAPGRPFLLCKLRTMRVVASDTGVSGGDKTARITGGRFST